MKFTLLPTALICCSTAFFSQTTKRVLFIGNSYTGVNNLPQMTADLTDSAGDSLIFDAYNPGGQTFQGHFADPIVASRIAQGNWDFVILQEQSQRPAFSDWQVAEEVFPYAHKLDSMVRTHNPCGETLFYMTWGRKNGDASNCPFWPPICTYTGMDSLLHLRYMQMADDNDAAVSPVGRVWHNIRDNYPNLELYSGDESHPAVAGTYAAACTFYTTIFGKNPLQITSNQGLNATDAQIIRQAAKDVAYDSLSHWFYGAYQPDAAFNYMNMGGNQLQFTNESAYSNHFEWDFGDGESSGEESPAHTFAQSGNYTVKLVVSDDCGLSDTISIAVNTVAASMENPDMNGGMKLYPNPASALVFVDVPQPGFYKLLDFSGRKLFDFYFEKEGTIDLSKLGSGNYLFQNEAGKRVILRKL